MCFYNKATVNYNFSRNGGRHVRIHVIGARKLTLLPLGKSMNYNVFKFGDILPSVTEIWPKIEKNKLMTCRSRSLVKVTVVPNLKTYVTYNISRYKNVQFC